MLHVRGIRLDASVSATLAEKSHAPQLILRLRGGGGCEDRSMGFATGGRIKQAIYEDSLVAGCYDFEAGQRVFVHAINAIAWE